MNASSKRPEAERYWHQIWDGDWKKYVPIFHTVGCSTIYMQPEGGSDHDAFPGMLDEWIGPEMEDFVNAGYIMKADTLEELADKLGFEGADKRHLPANLRASKRELRQPLRPRLRAKEPFRLSAIPHPSLLRLSEELRSYPVHA